MSPVIFSPSENRKLLIGNSKVSSTQLSEFIDRNEMEAFQRIRLKFQKSENDLSLLPMNRLRVQKITMLYKK